MRKVSRIDAASTVSLSPNGVVKSALRGANQNEERNDFDERTQSPPGPDERARNPLRRAGADSRHRPLGRNRAARPASADARGLASAYEISMRAAKLMIARR